MLRNSLIGASLALGLALPSMALAATERWAITPSAASGHQVTGHIDYDRAAAKVTGGSLEIATVNKVYTYMGKSDGTGLILEANSPAFIGQSLYVIDFAGLSLTTGGAINLQGHYAQCDQIEATLCTGHGPLSPEDAVTATLQAAPAMVPTLTQWAMILMGTALAGGAALTLQARHRRA